MQTITALNHAVFIENQQIKTTSPTRPETILKR